MATGDDATNRVDLQVERVDRIVIGYLVLAGGWILLSGSATAWVADATGMSQTGLEIAKGLLFVLATGLGLRVALRPWARRVAAAGERERVAAAGLREVDRMRSAFLRGVSHELRTPLTSIVGYAETIQRLCELGRGQEVEPFAERLVVNAGRLEHLILDLLETNALLHDGRPPRLDDVDMADLVRRTVDMTDLQDRQVELVGSPLTANLDTEMLRRILEVLLGNVVRHTPPATVVTISWSRRPGWLEIVVEDDGPGFPDQIGQRAFEPFVQGSAASQDAQPGVGIGLTLVAQYVRLHGGRVLATNRGTGGARVEIHLPDALR